MLLAYFLLTFVLTWAAWFTAAALAGPGNTGGFGVRGPVFLFGVFAPALVALVLTARAEGRAGVWRLLARIGRWRVGTRWYVFAIGYFAAIKLAAALVHRVATDAWPRFGDTSWALLLGAILVSTWVQAGEELGWRGYALPRLAGHLGLGGASILLGGMWALWHLPLFFLSDTGSTGQSFPIYLLQVTAISVTMAWLYWKTEGSLLLVMLMHASVNNATGIVPAAVAGAVTPLAFRGSLVAWVTVGLSWAVAAPLLARMRGADIRGMRSSDPRAARLDEPERERRSGSSAGGRSARVRPHIP
ncbi:MAG: CPBP family intramembrane glutamic endopeptidase [Gemmatirosa sp.]